MGSQQLPDVKIEHVLFTQEFYIVCQVIFGNRSRHGFCLRHSRGLGVQPATYPGQWCSVDHISLLLLSLDSNEEECVCHIFQSLKTTYLLYLTFFYCRPSKAVLLQQVQGTQSIPASPRNRFPSTINRRRYKANE